MHWLPTGERLLLARWVHLLHLLEWAEKPLVGPVFGQWHGQRHRTPDTCWTPNQTQRICRSGWKEDRSVTLNETQKDSITCKPNNVFYLIFFLSDFRASKEFFKVCVKIHKILRVRKILWFKAYVRPWSRSYSRTRDKWKSLSWASSIVLRQTLPFHYLENLRFQKC